MQPRGAVGIDCARKGWPPIHVRRSCGGYVLQSYATAIAIHHMPDNILVDAITPNRSILGYGAAHSPGVNRGRRGPLV